MAGSPRPAVPPARDRFVVLRDRDGRRQAIARQAVSALCEDEAGGTLLLLPGGRLVAVDEALDAMLALFG